MPRACPIAVLAFLLNALGCHRTEPAPALQVGCAANLAAVFPILVQSYAKLPGSGKVLASFGATGGLTEQIENGAPFDVFLSADEEHVRRLEAAHLTTRSFPYATGRVVIYCRDCGVRTLRDLVGPRFKVIAVARPETAPYGRASVEALHRAGLWDRISPKIVYAPSIAAVKTFVDTGNADAGLTAFSLAQTATPVDADLYRPIIQAGCVLARGHTQEAERFARFLASAPAQKILRGAGYGPPSLK